MIPWCSHHPRSMLRNFLRNEMKRAIRNGSGPTEVASGIQILKRRYLANGYPSHVISKAINEAKRTNIKAQKERKVRLFLPFNSEHDVRALRNGLRRTSLSEYLSLSFTSKPLHRMLSNNRENECLHPNCVFCANASKNDSCMTKMCVYSIQCRLCEAEYIGETQRTMRSRLKEHVSVTSSNVYRHLQQTHGKTDISCVTWAIVHRSLRFWNIRQRVEAMTIAHRRPILNAQLM